MHQTKVFTRQSKKKGEKGAVCVYNVQMEDEDISTS